jgi:hypothetical protein
MLKKQEEVIFKYCTLVSCDMVLISGSLGTLNIRISSSDFGRARAGILKQFGVRTWTGQRSPQFAGVTLRVSCQSEKAQSVHSGPLFKSKCKFFLLIDLFVYLFRLILLFLHILYVQVYPHISTCISVAISSYILDAIQSLTSVTNNQCFWIISHP